MKTDHVKKQQMVRNDKAVKTSIDDHVFANSNLENDDEHRFELLRKHNMLDSSQRKFENGITLGYVTPWNSHGYDLAKWAAHKFTHISPVWFQLRSKLDGENLSCQLDGTHDIDQDWMTDLKKNNSNLNIVPRIIFEGWFGNDLKKFLTDKRLQIDCSRKLCNFLKANHMAGAVLEIWLQVMTTTQGSGTMHLLEFIESLAHEFHTVGLTLILPLSPPLDPNFEETGIVNKIIIERLLNAVDYLNVMAYDYPSSKEFSGVAPIKWAESNIRFLLNAGNTMSDNKPSKILLGLNFYGYDRSDGKIEAILGTRFIDLISEPDTNLMFDQNAGENLIIYGRNNKNYGLAYYPTLRSLEMRVELARRLNVGIAIWELGQGLDYFTFIL